MALLDTSVPVDLTRSARSADGRRAQAVLIDLVGRGESIFTSRLSDAELRVGPHRAPDPAAELVRVEGALRRCRILEFDARAAARFAEVKAHLLSLGRPPGDMDVQIAAVALVHAQTLLTRNAKHFADVPGLAVRTY